MLFSILKKSTCTNLLNLILVSFFWGSFHDKVKVWTFFASLLHRVPLLSFCATAEVGKDILEAFPFSVWICNVQYKNILYWSGPRCRKKFGYRETLLLNVKCSLGLTVKFIANLARMQSPTDQFPIFISWISPLLFKIGDVL